MQCLYGDTLVIFALKNNYFHLLKNVNNTPSVPNCMSF